MTHANTDERDSRTPPDKRCGCNTAASETSCLAIDRDMLSECAGCGAVWSLNDGTPPDYIAYLLKLLFESGDGAETWVAKVAIAAPPVPVCEVCHGTGQYHDDEGVPYKCGTCNGEGMTP